MADEIRILTKSYEYYAAGRQLVVQQRNGNGYPNQGKLTTFRNIRALGFTAREAVECIQDCEREG